jgi:hypothetical protein
MSPGASTRRERLTAVGALEARDESQENHDRDHRDEHAHARRRIADGGLNEDAVALPKSGKGAFPLGAVE